MQAPQPLMADTAVDHSSKSSLSTPGLLIDDVHAQLGRQGGVFLIFHQVQRPIVDVVHAHDGGGGLGGVHRLGRQNGRGVGLDQFHHRADADGVGRGQEAAPLLLVVQHGLIGERGQVQRDVLAIGRDQIAQGVDGHFGSFQEAAIARDAVACCLSRKWREGALKPRDDSAPSALEQSEGRQRPKN